MSKFSNMRQKARNKLNSFKTKTKNKFNSIKQNVKNKFSDVKNGIVDYGNDLSDCFVVSYNKGYDDYDKLPKVFGSKFAAATGYNMGLGDKKRKKERKFTLDDLYSKQNYQTNTNTRTYNKSSNKKYKSKYRRKNNYAY